MNEQAQDLARATLGGGCFWCLEAAFDQLDGVHSVRPGYAGGHTANPSYQAVCRGDTGHAEVVQIAYDPARIGYRDLLSVFFGIHDPTTVNRQGHDVGPQYRSIILHHDDEQRTTAEAVIAELTHQAVFAEPIVTELQPLEAFHEAEAYHHDYYVSNRGQGYCEVIIAPKVAAVRERFAERLKR